MSTLQSNDGKVVTKFLPPNTTSLIQPMDQGILGSVKRRYKKSLLHFLVVQNDCSSKSIPEIVKELTNKDAVFWAAQAWEEINQETLMNGWNKLLQKPDFPPSESPSENPVLSVHDTTEVGELFDSLGRSEGDDSWQSPDNWLNEDSSESGHQLLEDDEIVASINNTDAANNSDSESSDGEPSEQVTHSQAFEAFDIALKWLESLGNTDPAHLLMVRKWRDLAAVKRTDSLKQTKITTYFKINES